MTRGLQNDDSALFELICWKDSGTIAFNFSLSSMGALTKKTTNLALRHQDLLSKLIDT